MDTMDQSPNERLQGSPAPALSHAEIRTIILGVLLAMFLAALDQTIIATALPTIGRELGDLEHLPWIVTVYLLTSTAVTPLYGKFSDSYGRRVTMLVGIVIFIAGSIACALAPTMFVLILARALQGIGGGGLIALAQTIIADIVAPRERGRYQVYFASVFMTSSLLGPVLGGFFAEHMHWSVIFWINIPLGLVALVIAYHSLKKLPRHDRPHRLDLLGAALLVAATVALLLGLSWGGIRYPWGSLPVLGLFAASLVLWGLFAMRMRLAPEPLIPPGVLHNPVVRMARALRLLRHGHLYRAHHLPAGLFRDRARPLREPFGPLPHSAHGRNRGRRDPVRPQHGEGEALQAAAHRRPSRRHGDHRPARGLRPIPLPRHRRDHPRDHQRRPRHGAAGHHGVDAERGGAASDGNGDRHGELLPLPRRRLHRGDLRRHRASAARA